MNGGTLLGKHSNGPDATDVAMMMSAIGSLHGCQVVLTVTAGTQGHNGSLAIQCEGRFELLPGSSLPRVVTTQLNYPTGTGESFEGLLYSAVWQLDHAISEAYEAMPLLPEA
jgi:hypothetical protein